MALQLETMSNPTMEPAHSQETVSLESPAPVSPPHGAAPVETSKHYRTAPQPGAAAKPLSPRDLPAGEDYNYKPISLLAPLTLFFAFCSLFGVFGLFGVILAGVGVIVGALCLRQIRNSEGELGGRGMALAGTLTCLAMGVGGGSYQGYVYATEVPEGYERVDFNWLAKLNPVFANGKYYLTEDLKSVDGKKVYVKGYMYPMEQTRNLTAFVLCKDTGECCFGGKPKIGDMIKVAMMDGLTVDHRELIYSGVAGTLRVKPVANDTGELVNLYMLEGTHFR